MISYEDYAKHHGMPPVDVNMGYINGRDVSIKRVSATGIPLELGQYTQDCPLLRLKNDSTVMLMCTAGMLEIDLDVYIRLRRPDSDVMDDDAWASISLSLVNADDTNIVLRKIRDVKVGLGIHLISFRAYVEVCRFDRLRFQLVVITKGDGLIVDYYNNDEDVYTWGTVRMIP